MLLTKDELRKLFVYCPETGVLTRRVGLKKGKAAESVITHSGKKYFRVSVNGKTYPVHRIIWVYMFGVVPNEIDHINGNGLDNRLCNLRNVDRSENCRNQRLFRTSTSGYTGVCWCKKTKKWMAYIKVNQKNINLGRYNDKKLAIKARSEANIKYGFHRNHGADRPL